MKKTVFLFLLGIILFSAFNVTKAAETETVYEFAECSIVIEVLREDGYTGFSIEKSGINSFYALVIDDDKSYYVNGVEEYLDKYVVFGYVHIDEAETFYDSFIIVFDNQGSIEYEEISDYDSLEETKEVFVLNDILIVSTDQHIDDNGYKKIKNYFVGYSPTFEKIKEIEIINDRMSISKNESLLLINLDYDLIYEYGINSDLDIISKSDVLGVENNAVYSEGVFLEFINELKVNDSTYNEPFLLDYPGNYNIEIDSIVTSFLIEPTVTGVIDNQVTNEDVIIDFSAGNALLNNDVYLSGEVINKPGNYELLINGANGYSLEYNFVITSNISGIINNNVYNDEVTLLFNGDGYINNQYISSGESIDEEGDYVLKINGENNYLETYYFEIDYPEEDMTFIEVVQKFDILVLVIVLASGAVILKKR